MTHRLHPLGWLDVLASTLILALLAASALVGGVLVAGLVWVFRAAAGWLGWRP